MTSVWVVQVGEYSDKYIAGIFSTEKVANDYASTFSSLNYGEQAHVEEYDLNDTFDKGSVYWRVEFLPDSSRFEEGVSTERYEELPEGVVPGAVERQTATYWEPGYYQDVVYIQHPDAQVAIKIAADKVAQFRAERAGIT